MYGTVAEVQRGFPSQQWDPATGEPDTAAVTAWLATWSDTLDGEIGHLVQVPVSPSASPSLEAVCAKVTTLRAAAEVYDFLNRPADTQASDVRLSETWRKQAATLVKGIQGGAVADGIKLDGVDAGGPLGDTSGSPSFSLGMQF